MIRQLNSIPNQRLLISAAALLLCGIFGIAAGMAWVPAAAEVKEVAPFVAESRPAPYVNPEASSDVSSLRGKCRECGIVESMREVWTAADGSDAAEATEVTRPARGKAREKLTRSYVLTVRMKDGARRQFVDASAADWRPGERVILIRGGTDD